jgi:hypothetical protein
MVCVVRFLIAPHYRLSLPRLYLSSGHDWEHSDEARISKSPGGLVTVSLSSADVDPLMKIRFTTSKSETFEVERWGAGARTFSKDYLETVC